MKNNPYYKSQTKNSKLQEGKTNEQKSQNNNNEKKVMLANIPAFEINKNKKVKAC